MFERFTTMAREVVIGAQQQARERGATSIRTEHLLAAFYRVPDNLAVTVLEKLNVAQADIERDIDRLDGSEPLSDAEALATIGIDLEEVRRQVEEAFGPGALDRTRAAASGGSDRPPRGHIPFEKTAKKTLELALREAVRLKHNYVGTEHILLGMLHEGTGEAGRILRAHGVQLDVARGVVAEIVRARRAS